MKKFFVIILSASLTLFACEKEIKLKESEIKSRIVVSGLFEANETLQITLSESRNILFNNGGVLPSLSTAKAELFGDDNQSLGKFIHEGSGDYYLPDFLPEADVEYILKVQNTGFDDVESKTKIPKAVTITKVDTVRKGDDMTFDISFKDLVSVENFYNIVVIPIEEIVTEVEPGVFETTYYSENEFACSKDVATYGEKDAEGNICAARGLLLSDIIFDGSEYTYTLEKSLLPTQVENNAKVVGFILQLKVISPELYKYRTTLQKYNQVQNNPFGEPVQVFSNITNGFGIFAGQSVFTDTIFVE